MKLGFKMIKNITKSANCDSDVIEENYEEYLQKLSIFKACSLLTLQRVVSTLKDHTYLSNHKTFS